MEDDKKLLASLIKKIDSIGKRIDTIDVRLTRLEIQKDKEIAKELRESPPASKTTSPIPETSPKSMPEEVYQAPRPHNDVKDGSPLSSQYTCELDESEEEEDLITEASCKKVPSQAPFIKNTASFPSKIEKSAGAFFEKFKGKSLADLEIMFGGNLLNKIGVVVFILGIVFLLAWARKYFSLGKIGKIIMGNVISLSMIGGGIWGEKKENFVYYGHGLIAGGWALLYFITFAMFNIEAVKLFHSPLWCTILLTMIAAGMISHSLKYKNEWLTIICYCLGFVTLILVTINTLSLIGTAILALSLIVISIKLKWDHLNLLGVIACYVIWGYWFSKTGHFDNATFTLGASIIFLYWLTFFLPIHVFPFKKVDNKKDNLVIASHMANTVAFIMGFSLLMDKIYPQYLYIFWGAAGIFYLASSAWIRFKDIPLFFYINGTVSSLLFMIAIPNRVQGVQITFGWIIVSQIVYMAGIRLKEHYFRLLGFLLLAVPCIKIFVTDIYKIDKLLVFNGFLSWRIVVVTLFICANYFIAFTTKTLLAHYDEKA